MRSRIDWTGGLWSLLVLLAAVVMTCGLAYSFNFIVRSPTDAEGHRLVLLGAMAFAGASVWARLRRRPLSVCILTALPAVVVGGLAIEFPDGLLAHLAALFLVPPALGAMLAELQSPAAPV